MKTPVDQMFFRDKPMNNTAANASATPPVEANLVTVSAPIDVRYHGADRTKDLVARIHWNNSKGAEDGAASIEIQTSAEGKNADAATGTAESEDWATVAGPATLSPATIDDNAEITIPYPKKPKQFIRLKVTVTSLFDEAPILWAGLDADAEYDYDTDLMQTR